MAENGIEYIPQNMPNSGLTPNRSFALWPYSKINDSRFCMTDKYVSLTHDSSVNDKFKFGIMQQRPWAAYFHHGDMFVKKYELNQNASHSDYGSTFETYVDKNVLEMETLGELKMINPGESNSHTEKWIFFKGVSVPSNDEEMDAIAEKHKLEDIKI